MTLRAPSRSVQWVWWLVGAVLAACAYVILFRLMYEGALGDIFGARQLRVLLPVLAAFFAFAYETRWDGVVRKGKGKSKSEEGKSEGEEGKSKGEEGKSGVGHPVGRAVPRAPQSSTVRPAASSVPQHAQAPLPGEAEYLRARAMPHRQIPDYKHDCDYLDMLEESANLGYPRALVKLGKYALRKGMLVEAYFWMSMAEKRGWKNATIARMNISRQWMRAGRPSEHGNVTEWFSEERGSLSRALLRRDCRVDMPYAQKRLAEFLANGDEDARILIGKEASNSQHPNSFQVSQGN